MATISRREWAEIQRTGLVNVRRKADLSKVPIRTRTGPRTPPRRPVVPPYKPSINSDLRLILRAHAIQSSQLANLLAKREYELAAFAGSPGCDTPLPWMEAAHEAEMTRRSALEDLRRSIRTLADLKRERERERVPGRMFVAARVAHDHAEIAVGSAGLQLGEAPTEDDADAGDAADAGSSGAPAPRALKEWRS